MMKKKKLLALLLAGAMSAALFAGCGGNDSGDNNDGGDDGNPDNGGGTITAEDTSVKLDGKIYVVGDSTVCSFSDSYYIPRYGYGTQISDYINIDSSNVKNLALSGRSSWSYTYNTSQDKNNKYNDDYSYYEYLSNSISSGDYLFIGFGHNDEKREVARYTDPTLGADDVSTTIGTYNANRTVSFKYVLKHYYIDVAKAAGATPVLCTPITRLYEDSKKASYDSVHVTTTTSAKDDNSGVTTTWNGGNYAQAIKELAEEENLLCIDLTDVTKTDYKALGYDEASKYHAATGAKWVDEGKTIKVATGLDATHTNLYGAKMNAYYIANAVKSSNLALSANVRTNIVKPAYANYETAIVNSGYTIPDKESFDPTKDASTFWQGINGTTVDSADTQTQYKWYATAFGASAKADNNYFKITQDNSDGLSFTLKAESGKGKIESGGDSIAAVFIQVPFKTAFSVTVTANVTSYGGNQAGFGLMVRDDIYIDANETVNSNYVTAGCRGTSTNAVMCYERNNSSLTDSTNKVEYPTAGDTFNLSLARSSQSITANMNDYAYSAVSDFDLAVSDSDYVYICLWVARAEVTFSNITFASSEWTQA
ncbi:MAG: hypothetical protein K2N33_01400 [Clostridia bacterium]|nr:hypothetical protein [Clostridia bacterium]